MTANPRLLTGFNDVPTKMAPKMVQPAAKPTREAPIIGLTLKSINTRNMTTIPDIVNRASYKRVSITPLLVFREE